MQGDFMGIHQNLATIHREIRDYEDMYSRTPNSVVLLGASKGQSLERIRAAIAAGQRVFGENYVQEALSKITALADEKLEWHFIGSIQSNKIKKIAEHFDWVQSIGEGYIAERLNAQRPDHLPPLNICLEVNISHELTKSGLKVEDVLSVAEMCRALPHLKLRGLMAIPVPKFTLADQRAELSKLRLLFEELNKKGFGLDTLSMGMSKDMQAAIAEGATMVRIGTALFGQRE